MNRRITGLVLWIIIGSQPFAAAAPDNKTVFTNNQSIRVYATGYFCVYNCELAGTQTVTKMISNSAYTLKASFLYGGQGVVMQGTGRTSPDGDYIKHAGGGGGFIRIAGPDAGKNLDGQWVENPAAVKERYALAGITDFKGFGNLMLRYPEKAKFIRTNSFTGCSGQTLKPWHSISVDPAFIPIGKAVEIRFQNGVKNPACGKFVAEDIGSAIKGKHVEIYLGEGQQALERWRQTGSNRYVDIYLNRIEKNPVARE